jgi:RNA polymerase sigma-70 factor (ECF subfamily)
MAPSNVISHPGGHPDLALAERCRQNEPGAFEEVYRLHAPRLFGLTYRLVGVQEAEDLLQEIFLAAHRKMSMYKGESSLGTWLFRLATNQCLDYLRSKRARLALLTETFEHDPDARGSSAGAIVGVLERMDLERALALLPPGARAVFVLHDVEGCEHREVAEHLRISEGTSKSQLHKARMRLRSLLAAPRTTERP